MKTVKTKINIPANIRKEIQGIINKFQKNGFECYLVGGSVRDLVLGFPVFDYDFATNALPEDVMKIFKSVVPTGIKHGTVTILIKDSQYEVTTYRADGKYLDGRRPSSVSFSDTLEEDIARRDFTINGLVYDIFNEEIIDYVDGLADIDSRIIRTIGDPVSRFREDGLRPYRSCRFASKLNFEIEESTFNAIPKTLDVARLVSAERVRDEIMKLIGTKIPSIGFEYMRKSGLMEISLPELYTCYEVSQNKYHMWDIYYHSLYSCDGIPGEDSIVRLAALLHDIGKGVTRREGQDGEYTFYNHEVVGAKICKKIMKRLKFSNEDISRVTGLVLNHMFHYIEEWSDGAVRRFLRKVGLENLDDLFLLRLADRRGNGQRDGLPAPILELKRRIDNVIEQDNALTVRDLEIDGHIIMERFNIPPGPAIGKILNELLELVLDDPDLNNRDFLVKKGEEIYERIKKKE